MDLAWDSSWKEHGATVNNGNGRHLMDGILYIDREKNEIVESADKGNHDGNIKAGLFEMDHAEKSSRMFSFNQIVSPCAEDGRQRGSYD